MEYTARFLAHSLMARSVVRKCGMLGTSRRMASVTRTPLMDRCVESSTLRRMLSSRMSSLSGIDDICRHAHRRSISTPAYSNLMMGTYASATATMSVARGLRRSISTSTLSGLGGTPPGSAIPNTSRLRFTCRGAMHSVSMSAPGPLTPSRYEPNVKMRAPVSDAIVSVMPAARDTRRTHSVTSSDRSDRTISRCCCSATDSYSRLARRYASSSADRCVSSGSGEASEMGSVMPYDSRPGGGPPSMVAAPSKRGGGKGEGGNGAW